MSLLESNPVLRTSRFRIQSGNKRDGIKCHHHTIRGEVPLHIHDHYEIELVTEGHMPQSVNGLSLSSGRGDFVFMDLHSVQRIQAPKDEVKLWTVYFSPGEIDPALARLLGRASYPLVGNLPPEKEAAFCRVADELTEVIKSNSTYAKERMTALATLLVTLLFENGTTPSAPPEEGRAYQYIQAALIYLNENFSSPLTLGEVAARIHISPCYLSDLFSRIVGCRFVEYLTRLRLECAQALLRGGKETIAEIAAACGFGTVSSFTRAFRRAVGVPPSLYRQGARTEK